MTAGIKNLRLAGHEVLTDGLGLPAKSIDAVLLFNSLHPANPVARQRAAAEVFRPGGRILAIHWRSEVRTSRGPDSSIRPQPEQIAEGAASIGLQPEPSQLLPPWSFGIVLRG